MLHALPLRRARRGRRDARPRLPRGRREDPRAHARLAARRRCSARRCRRRSARSPSATCYDPVTREGQGRDADRRHASSSSRSRSSATREGRRARARARGRAARPGDRLRAHEDPLRPALPHAARPRHERQGAARRHEPGLARRRDARRSRAAALPILVATDVAARGLDISTVTHVINFDVPDLARRLRPPHRPHRPRRALGPRDHVLRAAPEARPRGDRAPHRHADGAVDAGRARRPRAGRGTPAPPRQAARRSATATEPQRQADRRRRPRRRDRGRRPVHAVTDGDRPRRRGGPQRPRARALRVPRGPGRRGRPRRRGRRRDARSTVAALRLELSPRPGCRRVERSARQERSHVHSHAAHHPRRDRDRALRRGRAQDRRELPQAGRPTASTTASSSTA